MGIKELIAKLGKATGPDRELDAELFWQQTGHLSDPDIQQRYAELKSAAKLYDETAMQQNWRGYKNSFVPEFTSSIDAALTLVPEGWWWSIGQRVGGYEAQLWTPVDTEYENQKRTRGRTSTPARSLCIAALKAREDRP